MEISEFSSSIPLESVEPSNSIDRCVMTLSPNRSKYWIPMCMEHFKPEVGHYYDTIEDAMDSYYKYAQYCGFETRHTTHHKDRGFTTLKWIVCSREGIKNGSKSTGQRKTVSDRCLCKAKVVFTRQRDGRYLVKAFEERHTHPMLSIIGSEFLKSNFQLTEEHQQFVLDCSHAQLGPSAAYKLYSQIKGGPSNVGADLTQFLNYRRDLLSKIKGSDAQMVVNRFTKKKEVSSAFYFNYELDDKDCLVRLFWADPEMRVSYASFGEVVIFDSTYKTNRYDLVFAPFTGLDNHNHCVTFASCLILKEDAESYSWAFDNFKKAMVHEPKIFVTDQYLSMDIAAKMFSSTRHRLCMWHIMTKVSDKVGPILSKCRDFRQRLDSIVWDNESEPTEFEQKWNSLLVDYQLTQSNWFNNMFSIRQKWIPAYFRDVLLGGLVRSTSPSESQNSFFKNYLDRNTSLVEFMMHFDSAIDSQRYESRKLNAKEEKDLPDMRHLSSIERHCAEVFTLFAFKRIKEDIDVGCRVTHVDENMNTHVFTMKDLGDNKSKTYQVEYDPSIGNVVCSCSMFKRIGLPCRHVFRALNDLKVEKMPQCLVLSRWTKAATLTPIFSIDDVVVEECATIARRKTKLNSIRADINSYLLMIENDDARIDEFSIAIKGLTKAGTYHEGGIQKRSMRLDLMEEFVGMGVPDVVSVNDPVHAKNKGSGKRMKGGKEKAMLNNKRGSRKCSVCNQYAAHNAKSCLRLQADKRRQEELAKRARELDEELDDGEEETEDDDDILEDDVADEEM